MWEGCNMLPIKNFSNRLLKLIKYRYVLKNISDIFDIITTSTSLTKKDLCKSFCDNIADIPDKELFISNYKYLLNIVLKDVFEINHRVEELKKSDKKEPAEKDYLHRKLRYFIEKNQKALNEINQYILDEVYSILSEDKGIKYSDRVDDELFNRMLTCKYPYNFYKRYYDFYYDFSVEAKIRFMPGAKLDNYLEIIKSNIELKKNNFEEYQNNLSKIVTTHNVLEYLCAHIKTHNVLNKRLEVFNTLKYLYEHEQWQSFISLAVLQIEGLFYDCCMIQKQNKLSKTAGTYVEKVEKSFKNNDIIMLSVFPYFMYDIPDIRNEIAHTGYFDSDNLKFTANELIFDLNTLIKWIYDITHEKYTILKIIDDKLEEHSDANLNQKVELLMCEMLANTSVTDFKYLDLLKSPSLYSDEISYMKTPVGYWERIIEKIMNIIKTELFWNFIYDNIKDDITYKTDKLYNLVLLAEKLKNTFIPVLDNGSNEKLACQKVAAKIQEIKSKSVKK